jgi:hypothetical protein
MGFFIGRAHARAVEKKDVAALERGGIRVAFGGRHGIDRIPRGDGFIPRICV